MPVKSYRHYHHAVLAVQLGYYVNPHRVLERYFGGDPAT